MVNTWKETKEWEKKDSYYEFKDSPEYKLRNLLCKIADELQTKLINVYVIPQTADFYHIVYNNTVVGYIYKIENDFLARFFKELE